MPSFILHRDHDLSSSARRRCVRGSGLLAVAFLTLPALLLPASAQAEKDTAARKFTRGLASLTTGFLEVPGNMVQEGRTNGALSGVTIGFAMGLGKLVARTLTGAWDLVTAPFPIPSGFEPLLQPEFAWQYFDSAPGRAYGFSDTYLEKEKWALSGIDGARVDRRRGAVVVAFPNELVFDSSSADVSRAGKKRIKEVAEVLNRLPEAQFAVVGHTDSTGPETYNQWLSRDRARAVRKLLVEQGISSRRVVAEGYGEAAPAATNGTPEGRQANRRVEIQVRASGVGAYR